MTSTLLLDFDGPICGVFRGKVSSEAAASRLAAALGLEPDTGDPFVILAKAIAAGGGEQASELLAKIEVEAVQTAPVTTGVLQLMSEWPGDVGIVSSNDQSAIEHWLTTHDAQVDVVVGRWWPRMKPDPWPLLTAAWTLTATPDQCLYVGDQLSDMEAAAASQMRFVGFATRPDRRQEFEQAGCDQIVDNEFLLTLLT